MSQPCKISIIGGGSSGFAHHFVSDIVTRPDLADSHISLMDINAENLEIAVALSRKMASQVGSNVKIDSTMDRRASLDGADYVIVTILTGGFEPLEAEQRISLKYGVDQAVGCTAGPAGVFHALRYIPVLVDICKDMNELCPNALLLNYSNPTPITTWAVTEATNIWNIGLCHSVQNTAQEISEYIGAPLNEITYWAAGINHQAWFLRYEWNDEDAYPKLFESMKDPAIYEKDMVRFELMKYFGYFMSESSWHASEYVPYFRRRPDLIDRYAPRVGYFADMNAIMHKKYASERREKQRRNAFSDEPLDIKSSHEYAVEIIHALETNAPTRANINLMNDGLITNLHYSCVEVPCLIDRAGIHPCHVGDLPPQCAALNRNRSNQDELVVKGALEGNRKAIEQAVALDPLTASVLTLDEIKAMVDELFDAQKDEIAVFA